MCTRAKAPAVAKHPDLHEALLPLAGFIGTWKGDGSGDYPTVEPFKYKETLSFVHIGKPFIEVIQATQNPKDGSPMHREVGFLTIKGTDVSFVVSDPTGLAQVYEGTVTKDGNTVKLSLSTTSVGKTRFAKDVVAVKREFVLQDFTLNYTLDMQAVGCDMQHHLSANLKRHFQHVLSKADAKDFMQSKPVHVVDVRDKKEFEALPPLPEAVNVPLEKFHATEEQMTGDEFPWKTDKEAPILVCCRKGFRSLRAVEAMRTAGFVNAYSLDGGMEQWHASEE
eukprot:m.23854 g.23854  ORF g.23854 m.23854 type:complete len:280 (-) comp11099_c0_seq1:125-964(-)